MTLLSCGKSRWVTAREADGVVRSGTGSVRGTRRNRTEGRPMRKLLMELCLRLARLTVLAIVGYYLVFAMRGQAPRDAFPTIAGHDANCKVCRLPLFGHDGGPSQLGLETRVITGPSASLHLDESCGPRPRLSRFHSLPAKALPGGSSCFARDAEPMSWRVAGAAQGKEGNRPGWSP